MFPGWQTNAESLPRPAESRLGWATAEPSPPRVCPAAQTCPPWLRRSMSRSRTRGQRCWRQGSSPPVDRGWGSRH